MYKPDANGAAIWLFEAESKPRCRARLRPDLGSNEIRRQALALGAVRRVRAFLRCRDASNSARQNPVMRLSFLAVAFLLSLPTDLRAAAISFSCRLHHPPHLEIVGTNRGPAKYCRWVCWFKLLDNPYIGFVKSHGYQKLAGTKVWIRTGDDSIDWTTINWRCRARPPARS